MRLLTILSIAAGTMLAGCGPEPAEFQQAKHAVAAKFAYPGSAQFRNLRFGGSRDTVCGDVQGRHLDGEMTDFRRFSWNSKRGATVEAMNAGLFRGDPELGQAVARMEDVSFSVACKPVN